MRRADRRHRCGPGPRNQLLQDPVCDDVPPQEQGLHVHRDQHRRTWEPLERELLTGVDTG